jgi:hypothetical protein
MIDITTVGWLTMDDIVLVDHSLDLACWEAVRFIQCGRADLVR